MRKTGVVFLLIFLIPLLVFAEGENETLSAAKKAFDSIESKVSDNSLPTARDYFKNSSFEYRSTLENMSKIESNTLSAQEKSDYMFILLIISLRKPELLSYSKVKPDYISAAKGFLDSTAPADLFYSQMLYLYKSGFISECLSIIDTVDAQNCAGGLFFKSGEFALEAGNAKAANMFFDYYLGKVLEKSSYKVFKEEIARVENLFREQEYHALANKYELLGIKVALDKEDAPQSIADGVRHKAAVLYKQGSYSEAVKYYEVLYFKTKDPSVKKTIADIYFDLNEYEKALQMYLSIDNFEKDSYSCFRTGLCCYYLNDRAKAYSILRDLLKSVPDSEYSDDILYYLWKINEEAGLIDESGEYYNELKKRYPGSEYILKIEKQKELL
ncbi:tetratricopeptide repeat protein [bacterium]|jgi:tetratricopeptide (TPR) repeat protein|nr:tetratricopeptide repeat protein [bacterium]